MKKSTLKEKISTIQALENKIRSQQNTNYLSIPETLHFLRECPFIQLSQKTNLDIIEKLFEDLEDISLPSLESLKKIEQNYESIEEIQNEIFDDLKDSFILNIAHLKPEIAKKAKDSIFNCKHIEVIFKNPDTFQTHHSFLIRIDKNFNLNNYLKDIDKDIKFRVDKTVTISKINTFLKDSQFNFKNISPKTKKLFNEFINVFEELSPQIDSLKSISTDIILNLQTDLISEYEPNINLYKLDFNKNMHNHIESIYQKTIKNIEKHFEEHYEKTPLHPLAKIKIEHFFKQLCNQLLNEMNYNLEQIFSLIYEYQKIKKPISAINDINHQIHLEGMQFYFLDTEYSNCETIKHLIAMNGGLCSLKTISHFGKNYYIALFQKDFNLNQIYDVLFIETADLKSIIQKPHFNFFD